MPKKIIPKKFWNTDAQVKDLSRADFLIQLKLFGEKENIPNISWTGVDVIRFFLEMNRSKKVLEMGCANGFSSLIIADILEEWGGNLLTGDISEPSLCAAMINAEMCRLTNIEFRLGNILETVTSIDGPFDCIFIDAQKSWTHIFFSFAASLLSPSGIIIVDDTKKFPDKMKSFYTLLSREQAFWHILTIPENNGDALMVCTRK